MSDDAGRYLCEFIYFKSMEMSVKSGIPVLFCHVPQDGRPFSIKEMTEVILRLVGIMVDTRESEAGCGEGVKQEE